MRRSNDLKFSNLLPHVRQYVEKGHIVSFGQVIELTSWKDVRPYILLTITAYDKIRRWIVKYFHLKKPEYFNINSDYGSETYMGDDWWKYVYETLTDNQKEILGGMLKEYRERESNAYEEVYETLKRKVKNITPTTPTLISTFGACYNNAHPNNKNHEGDFLYIGDTESSPSDEEDDDDYYFKFMSKIGRSSIVNTHLQINTSDPHIDTGGSGCFVGMYGLSWDECLTLLISPVSLLKYSYPELVAAILWEITYHGFTEEDIKSNLDEIINRAPG